MSFFSKVPAEIWLRIGRHVDSSDVIAVHLTCQLLHRQFIAEPEWLFYHQKWKLLVEKYSSWEPFLQRQRSLKTDAMCSVLRYALVFKKGEFLRNVLDNLHPSVDLNILRKDLEEYDYYRELIDEQLVPYGDLGYDWSRLRHCVLSMGYNGFHENVRQFLDKKNIMPVRKDKQTLVLAATCGHLDVVDRLLNDSRVKVSGQDNCAIYEACKWGHLRVVDRLLQDPRLDATAEENRAITEASRWGHLHVVERLLQDPRIDPSDALCEASKLGHLQIVDRLLQDSRVHQSKQGDLALEYASHAGHISIVEKLLQDPHLDLSNNIMAVVTAHNMTIVEMLLNDPRVDPSADDNSTLCSAILLASRENELELVNRLLQDPRVDPSARNNEAIICAARNGNLPVIDRLLQDERVNPSARDNEILSRAISFPKIIACLLQDPRFDPTLKDYEKLIDFADSLVVYGTQEHYQNLDLLLLDSRVDLSVDPIAEIAATRAKHNRHIAKRLQKLRPRRKRRKHQASFESQQERVQRKFWRELQPPQLDDSPL